MKKLKFDSKTNYYYVYVPTGYKSPNGMTEYKKIRSKSIKSLEEKVNKMGGKN